MSGLVRVSPRLRVKQLPSVVVRAQSGGEVVANLGGSDRDCDVAQRGIMLGAWSSIIIEARDGSDRVRDKITYHIPPTDDGTITVEDDDGTAMIQRLDGGLAALVRKTRDRWQRRGWTVHVFYEWAAGLASERISQLRAELNTNPTEMGTWSDDVDPVTVASLRPGKDPSSVFTAIWGRGKR